MKNKYLIINNNYVKNDLHSFIIYLDYFSIQQYLLSTSKYFQIQVIRKIKFSIARLLMIMMYLLKIYQLRYKTEYLDDTAICIFKGQGEWGNIIKLIDDKGSLKIIKKVFNNSIYQQEQEFYNKYANNKSLLQLPKHVFKPQNIIEIEFLKLKSLLKIYQEPKMNI